MLLGAVTFGLVAIVSMPPEAWAQADTVRMISVNIRSQDLGAALTSFADQAGLRLLFPSDVVAGRTSPALSGSYTRDETLSLLLAGTGLSYHFTSANTVTITDRIAGGHDTTAADGSLVLDTINVTEAKWGDPADAPYRTPGSSSYISQEQIERFRGTSTADIFQGTPGVISGDARNSGGALDLNIRGMQGMNRVPIALDGAQHATTTYRGYQGIGQRSYIDPDLIGGISIDKGPALEAGTAGAIGGMVNMRTLNADDIVQDGKEWGVRVRTGVNTNSTTPPPVGTAGGFGPSTITIGSTHPNFPVVQGYAYDGTGAISGMDRPSLFDLTGMNGSVAAAHKGDNFEIVAALSRRKNGNYFSGESGAPYGRDYIETRSFTSSRGDYTRMYFTQQEDAAKYRGGEEVLNTSYDTKSALLKGTMRFDNESSLELGYIYYDSQFGDIMPSRLWGLLDGITQKELSHAKVDTLTAKYEWNPTDNDLFDFKANMWGTWLDNSTPTVDNLSYDFIYESKTDMWGFDLSNTSHFDTAFGGLGVTYGGSFISEDTKPITTEYTAYQARDAERWEASAFAKAELKPVDWLTISGGVRYQRFHTLDRRDPLNDILQVDLIEAGHYVINENGDTFKWYFEQGNYTGNGTIVSTVPPNYDYASLRYVPPVPEGEREGFAPSVSVTVEPLDGIQLYAQYAEGLRMPNLMETAQTFALYNSADIEPEHAKNWEFGINVLRDDVFTSGDEARFKLAYFDNRIDDYIFRNSLNYTIPFSDNLDKATFRGMEGSLSYDMGRIFVDASATYYTDIKYCHKAGFEGSGCFEGGLLGSYSQNQVPPRLSASLTMGARLFEDRLTVGGRVSHFSGRYGGDFEWPDEVGLILVRPINWDAYTLVDLFASYKVADNLTLDVSAENIFDKYYVDALAQTPQPGPGRTIRASLTARF